MKIKTSELQGAALDWAVAKCEGLMQGQIAVDGVSRGFYKPSTDWAQGGPIIEREKISVLRGNDLYFPKGNEKGEFYEPLWIATRTEGPLFEAWGSTPLIAAMRCYVSSKLGDEVEVPDEIVS